MTGGDTMIDPMNPILDVPTMQGLSPDNSRDNVDAKTAAKPPAMVKSIVDLTPGDTFAAEILDIQHGVVTLKIGENPLAARTLVSPDARIGDKAVFLVKEAMPGQIMLEFLRSGGTSQVSGSIIKEALAAANMQLTHKNSELIDLLVSHNLPIDHHSVQRAAFFRYSMPDAPFAQIAFLMENNFAPIDSTVEVFSDILDGRLNIQAEIANLQSGIDAMPDAVRADLTAKTQGKLMLELAAANAPDLGIYLSELRALVDEIAAYLQNNTPHSEAQAATLRQTLANIGDILDFAANIDSTKLYYQFPFIINGRQNMADLHVMKRKAAKKSAVGNKNATALIALNMPHLGRIEVLVDKNERNVKLQFRSDSGLTLYTINNSGAKLSEMLGDKGFTLTGIALKMTGEKFDITRPVAAEGKPTRAKARTEEESTAGPKRYSFDMRV